MPPKSLYSPYKAVGCVTDGVPFGINRLGEELFLYASIGNTFQVYKFNRLTVCLVSRPVPGVIRSIQAFGRETFVVVNKSIFVYDRTNIVREYADHQHDITGILSIGRLIISYDEENFVKIYDTKIRELVNEMKMLQRSKITTIIHPSTYINKILIGYQNGELELWNINRSQIIYTFKSHIKHFSNKSKSEDFQPVGTLEHPVPEVVCIEQSPACDVVAVGFSSGDILIMNLKFDKVLFTFHQSGGAVSSLSFRTDVGAEKFPFLCSGSEDGRVYIWNLGKPEENPNFNGNTVEEDGGSDEDNEPQRILVRRLESTIADAHSAMVSKVHFVHGEPILITSSVDNSIKVWIFDSSDGKARLLRSREGHCGPPTRIRFYGGITNASIRDNANGFSCEMISAGSDGCLRYFNTALESQNREMSQKPILKKLNLWRRNEKLPQTIAFDFSESRQRDWSNLVTVHRNHTNAYLWKFKDRVITEVILRQPHWRENDKKYSIDRSHHSTAVAASPCGNFCVVGSRGGVIYQYNMQSGLHRGTFPVGLGSVMSDAVMKVRAATPGNVIHELLNALDDDSGEIHPQIQTLAKKTLATTDKNVTKEGHTQEVTGLFIDSTNSLLVSCGLDGLLIFWNFRAPTHAQLAAVQTDTPQMFLHGFRDGGFVALAGQDRVVRVYDLVSHKLSRRFAGHSREVSDIAFTPDGRRLITSSLDSTIRTWDMPTGRCISWVKFDSSVLSMAVSLSGEYLCITQAEKDGIYMYVDRSLYETIHFWKEPTVPTPVADSLVMVESNTNTSTSSKKEADAHARADSAFSDGKYDSGWTGEDEEEEDSIGQDIEEEEEEEGEEVVPSQGQVITGLPTESTEQRGAQSITMSAIPRAYWVTLFHLEAIKERNKPKLPPVPAPNAPFFLPTVIRGGSQPSFPTPNEFAQMMTDNSNSNTSLGAKRELDPSSTAVSEGLSIKRNKAATVVVTSTGKSDEDIAGELAAMSSAWNDDDGDSSWPAETEDDQQEKDLVAVDKVSNEKKLSTPKAAEPSKSKILRGRQAVLPRCTLVAYILKEYPTAMSTIMHAEDEMEQEEDDGTQDGPILGYLKTIAPPAIDAEMRSLCLHDGDEEGIKFIRILLKWFKKKLASGNNFEVLQAYLHRMLTIYSEILIKIPEFALDVEELHRAHDACGLKFRHLIQKNLCLLKVLARMPIL